MAWVGWQLFILARPQTPLLERPLHLGPALLILLLAHPFPSIAGRRLPGAIIDGILALGIIATTVYYLTDGPRLAERMEGIDEILFRDKLMGSVLLLALLEGVRRKIGWMLLSVLLLFVALAFVGRWDPEWSQHAWVPEVLRYQGMAFEEFIESLTMTSNGVLGITTATSVGLVFYFVLFGSLYSAIGGGQLFIDLGLKLAGRQPGGAAKAAVVSSSLMGSISGSAVANVATTGLFTIPLMRKTGYQPAHAAGIEAIASTGGQLMPPIMGVAAFVMAELLQLPYREIVVAGLIPALAFYLSIFLVVHFEAFRNGLKAVHSPTDSSPTIAGRLYLLIPPCLLVGLLLNGWSAPMCAVAASGACLVTAYLRRGSRLGLKDWAEALRQGARQAAAVAIPIAAIGLIIEIAIQSNLALKFSANLMSLSGGSTVAALALIVVGCLVMGMGLPTVAAYIIGSILFVPALIDLGVESLAAHFFVMYYCVLSMITPPVALASYAAAGIASANAFGSSLKAFRLSWVAFLIPFAFVFEPSLIGQGSGGRIALACLVLLIAVFSWAVAIVGFWKVSLPWFVRTLLAVASMALFAAPMIGKSGSIGAESTVTASHWIWALPTVILLAALSWHRFFCRARSSSG